jgi:hypothetical protein
MGLFDPFPVPEQWEPPADGLISLLPGSGMPSGRCMLDGMPIFCRDAANLLHIGAAEFEHPTVVWDGGWIFVSFNRQTEVYQAKSTFTFPNIWNDRMVDVVTVTRRIESDTEQLFRLFAFAQSRSRGQSKKPAAMAPVSSERQIVPLGNLQKGLEDILKTKDCADFVQKLIDKANSIFGGGRPHATSFWDAFSRIQDAGGYQLTYQPGNGNTVTGDLFFGEFTNPSLPEISTAGPGTVYIAPFGPIGRSARPDEAALAQARYAFTALHETLHLAKLGLYNDEQLARAAHAVDKTSPPSIPSTNYLGWSGNFDELLKKHCAYPLK